MSYLTLLAFLIAQLVAASHIHGLDGGHSTPEAVIEWHFSSLLDHHHGPYHHQGPDHHHSHDDGGHHGPDHDGQETQHRAADCLICHAADRLAHAGPPTEGWRSAPAHRPAQNDAVRALPVSGHVEIAAQPRGPPIQHA